MLRQTRNILWRLVAICAVLLGLLGIVLPVLPTVPFLILAAFAGGKGWPALERWLLEHPRFGPHIRNWRERGAVPRKAKVGASVVMMISVATLAAAPVPGWVQLATFTLLIGVATWLWRRPEH